MAIQRTVLPGAVAKFTMLVNDRLKQLDGTEDPRDAGIRQGLIEAGSLMLIALAADDQGGDR
jgi:hypothetical protein